MESTPPRPTAAEAAAALADAESSRTTLAGRIVTPPWFFTSIGAAIAVQIATMAAGLGDGGLWALIAGLAVFAAVAGLQLARFRALNGVWLGGFASRVALGTGTAASASYAIALAGAMWAAYAGRWWLVAVCAMAGGAAYALSGRRWMHAYRAAPARHGRGESIAWLALLAVVSVAGLVVLAANA